jgi:hypothetical protein
MKGLLLAALAVMATMSFAGGFSLGFKEVELPIMVSDEDAYMGDMTMLRLGSSLSPEFRVEVLLGYDKQSFSVDDSDYSASSFGIGGSAFYVIARPTYSVFSIGGSLVYGSTSTDYDGDDGPKTTDLSIFPVMRVDFSIPSLERVAFFSEFGARYDDAKTTLEQSGEDLEWDYSRFGTFSSPHILGGVYYSF